MADHSAIQWTDATWNPTTGCTKISPGCSNCYIERTPAFRIAWRRFERGATDLRLHENRLDQPLHWRKPRRVFVNSLSDLFHESVPDTFIARVFETMALSARHTFQILTKRPQRMLALVPTFATQHTAPNGSGWPLPNVWLGVSVENQHFADERIPLLLQTPAAVRFISAEPLLGSVLLDNGSNSWLSCTSTLTDEQYEALSPREQADHCCCEQFDEFGDHFRGLDWVIVGGESGPQSRAFDVAWARSIVRQCHTAAVPVFVKQLGANAIGTDSLRDKKGGDPNEWPADLRVREFPRVEVHA
jgi:protein gp37